MIYFILAGLIVLLDQVSKFLLSTSMTLGGTSELIPGFIRLTYVHNTGAAFSFLSDMRWLLVAVTFIVLVVIVYILIRYGAKLGLIGRLGLSFILGGALSNFIDRAIFGYVADFFEFEFVRFAVFNVADIFITVGGIGFCLYYLFHRDDMGGDFMLFERRKKPVKTEDDRDTDQL
jgi:signal peptidase II